VVWGSDSGPAPAGSLVAPAAWSRGKRVEIIDRAAHWPHEEQSAKVNQLLIDFLSATTKDLTAPQP
jgi:pimeloyl-ACP methyl ester carboxylesterase